MSDDMDSETKKAGSGKVKVKVKDAEFMWEKFRSEMGDYYLNQTTKETTWNPPVDAWIQIHDPSRDAYYYHHTGSGETTWTRPGGFPYHESDFDSEEDRQDDAEGARAIERAKGGKGRWGSKFDPKSGHTFYWDSLTGLTTWERPVGVFQGDAEFSEEFDVPFAGPMGLRLNQDPDSPNLHVTEVFDGESAFLGGVEEKDVILAINDKVCRGVDLQVK